MLIFGRTIGLRANPFGLWLLTQLAYPNWVYAEKKDAIFGPNLKLPSVGAGFAAAPLTRIHHFTSLALEQLASSVTSVPKSSKGFRKINCFFALSGLLSAICLTDQSLTERVLLRERNCYERVSSAV